MENISAHEATLVGVNNFLPMLNEHIIEEVPGEKPLTEETPATEAPAPVEQKPEDKPEVETIQ